MVNVRGATSELLLTIAAKCLLGITFLAREKETKVQTAREMIVWCLHLEMHAFSKDWDTRLAVATKPTIAPGP